MSAEFSERESEGDAEERIKLGKKRLERRRVLKAQERIRLDDGDAELMPEVLVYPQKICAAA